MLVDVNVRSASCDGARGQPLDDGQTGGAEIQTRAEVALSDALLGFLNSVHDGPQRIVSIYII